MKRTLEQQSLRDLAAGIYDYRMWLIAQGHNDQRLKTWERELNFEYFISFHTYEPIDYSTDDGSGNRSADDITPDPCEPDYDAVTVAPASTDSDYDWRADGNDYPRDTIEYTDIRTAWHAKMDAMLKLGRYVATTTQAFAAFNRMYPQYA